MDFSQLVQGAIFDYDLYSWIVESEATFMFHDELPYRELRVQNDAGDTRYLLIEKKKNGSEQLFWLDALNETRLVPLIPAIESEEINYKGKLYHSIAREEGIVLYSKSKIRERAKSYRFVLDDNPNLFIYFLSDDRYEGRHGNQIEATDLNNLIPPSSKTTEGNSRKPFTTNVEPKVKSKRFNFAVGCAIVLVLIFCAAIFTVFFLFRDYLS